MAPPKRRLAAFLSTDAVGYTRLMSEDDLATHRSLESHITLMGALVQQHGGRVVNAVGDNLLAEFSSIVDTVSCAVEIQQAIELENRDVDPTRRMQYRIGVNIGDVIVDGEHVAGDGINVAARLESMADPGGICLAGAAFEQVVGKIPMDYEDLGTVELKNLRSPVRVYRIRVQTTSEMSDELDSDSRLSVPGFSRRPAIAVLPLENTSHDPEQKYFADGITEDLIASLANWRLLPVVDRNSSFAYRDSAVDIRTVGRELAVRYVVVGSIRSSGDWVRILVQLVDATVSHEVWSGRYTRKLRDIFELQDEITATIMTTLEPALMRAERKRVRRHAPRNLDAWECGLPALSHLYNATQEDNELARSLAVRASAIDPLFSPHFALLAATHMYDILYQWTPSPQKSLELALDAAQKSVALDDANPIALSAMGFVRALQGDLDRAAGSLRRALAWNPSLALAYYGLGVVAQFRGESDGAIGMFGKAIRLSPHDPMLHMFRSQLAQAHFIAERYADAATWARRTLELKPDPEALRVLGASCGYLGKSERARAALDQLILIQPHFSIDALRKAISPRLADRYIEGWKRAGWQK